MQQTLSLADEFFLVGHDEYSGKPVVEDVLLDTGLAGAVLAELVLAGRVTVGPDHVVLVTDRRAHGEPVGDAAVVELLSQPEAAPVWAWVEYLRQRVRAMVAPRLADLGLIERLQSTGLLRSVMRYPALDPERAAAPRARVRYMMEHPEQLDTPTTVLGALAGSAGLGHVFGLGSPHQAGGYLQRWALHLPRELAQVCSGVSAAVAAIPAH